jgi:hypothetical protein
MILNEDWVSSPFITCNYCGNKYAYNNKDSEHEAENISCYGCGQTIAIEEGNFRDPTDKWTYSSKPNQEQLKIFNVIRPSLDDINEIDVDILRNILDWVDGARKKDTKKVFEGVITVLFS